MRGEFPKATVLAALSVLLLGAAAAPQAAGPLASTPNRPWPTFDPADPDSPPVLSPADALKTFTMAPGYYLELVASEPLVRDPILMEFDPDGRLWVVELPGWAHNESMENTLEPVNRLVVLEDTDGDRVMDKRTVFLDKLVLPRAFKILDRGCALVGEPPNLWKACDTDGDLVADSKDLLDRNFATLGVLEHGANGLFWGMDNTIYVSEHDYNLRFRNGSFATEKSLRRGQWGVTQDDGGRIYRNVNTDPLFVDFVAPRYYVRNPDLVKTRGLYESLVVQETTNIWPAHPTRGLNRGYRSEVFREDGSASYYGGVSSPLIYRGTRLPREMHGQAFVADGPTNIVHALKLEDDGTGNLRAQDFYAKGEFLASTDVRFRPTALTPGWDGSFYIADMYRGVSQDGPLQTDYLKSWINKRKLARDVGYGRIYRVVHEGMGADPRPRMSQDSAAALVAHLSNPNGWWRDTAQQLLVQRADPKSVRLLAKLAAARKADPRARLHALWVLDGLGRLTPAQVVAALADASPDLRAAALRMSEPLLATGHKAVTAAALARLGDGNRFVLRQLAATLGELPVAARSAPLLALLKAQGGDPVLVDAAVSSLGGQEATMLAALLDDPRASPEALAMLAGATAKRREPVSTERLLADATAMERPEAVRKALLEGLALGLQGGAGSAGNAVAGGRAGGAIPGVGTQRTVVQQRFEMAAEPVNLTRLAAAQGALAAPARQVLALVNWPGRPAAPALPPRSAEEEKLFLAGKQIYALTCAACHQPQGEGSPGIAAPLAGSKRVVATGDVPVRILTNGYEGKLGLMPPLGAAMSDAELAALLTYVRQSWGNTGTPMVPLAVKEWRLAFAHRQTPWTDTELAVRQR